jgi:transposase
LPRVEEIIEPKNIPEGAVKIGEEVTELLEIKPLTVFVRRIVRPKYALPKEQGIIIAELPSLPIPKGNASSSLLTFILISKFVDHLPLYRLLQLFKRQNLVISKSTIGGWVSKTSMLLEPLYDSFKEKFLEDANYIQADESPIKVQDRDKKKALHQGYMWVYRKPDDKLILFDYNKGRSKKVPEEFFENFTGTLQSDGYKAYHNLTTKGTISLLGCMAHARRYFEKALDNDPKRADHILLLIQKLYRIERVLKEREASIDLIKRFRMRYANPVLNELELYLIAHKDNVLLKSSIGVAIKYTLNIYQNLKNYINDGRYEIDKNNIENAIRPLAIGRKNYLFTGSNQAAQNIAMFYSFFATCKTLNINPYNWLSDVIDRTPEHKANKLFELLPQNWSKREM